MGITRKAMVEHPKAKTKAKIRRVDDGELVSFSVPGAPKDAGFSAFKAFLAAQVDDVNCKAKETDLVLPSEALAVHHAANAELDENGMVAIARTISCPFSGKELAAAYDEYTLTDSIPVAPSGKEKEHKGKGKSKGKLPESVESRIESPVPVPSGNGTL